MRPNVLVVVMDTTRADHLSCYGYDRETTPELDAFAEEATLFENAIAPAGWTLPSHVSLVTGLLPSEHGVLHGDYRMHDDVRTLPEALSATGYDTAVFSNNPWVSPEYGFGQGVDHVEEVFREHVHKYKSGVGRNVARLKKALLLSDTGAESTNEAVTDWIDGRDAPFFALVNYMEPHQVYTPRRPYHRAHLDGGPLTPYREVLKNRRLHRERGRVFAGERPQEDGEVDRMRALYDGEISYLDDRLGELFGWLDRRDRLEETLVVVVGDHGEEFCDHSPFGPQLVDHHFALYDSIVRVPTIARLPGAFDADRVSAPVQLTDLPATVSDLVDDVDLRGGTAARSLLDPDPERVALSEYRAPPPQIESLREHAPDFDWSTYEVDLRAARSQQYKLIDYRDRDREELYDLRADPGERTDRRGEESPPDRLRERLTEWEQTVSVPDRSADVGRDDQDGERDEAVREHLADLGYR